MAMVRGRSLRVECVLREKGEEIARRTWAWGAGRRKIARTCFDEKRLVLLEEAIEDE